MTLDQHTSGLAGCADVTDLDTPVERASGGRDGRALHFRHAPGFGRVQDLRGRESLARASATTRRWKLIL